MTLFDFIPLSLHLLNQITDKKKSGHKKLSNDFLYIDIPEKSEVVPSESTLRFSELSAVPIEASDSRVSSSDARGSRASISKVNSSLQRQTLSR